MWLPGVRNGSPILACGSCHRVWWPDQRTPKPNCPGPDLAAIGRRSGVAALDAVEAYTDAATAAATDTREGTP